MALRKNNEQLFASFILKALRQVKSHRSSVLTGSSSSTVKPLHSQQYPIVYTLDIVILTAERKIQHLQGPFKQGNHKGKFWRMLYMNGNNK